MSRRRRPAVPRRQITVVCTGRGEHARIEIAVWVDDREAPAGAEIHAARARVADALGRDLEAVDLPEDDVRRVIRDRGRSRRATGARWTTVDRTPVFGSSPGGGRKAVLGCPRCRREVRLSETTLARLADGLYAAEPSRAHVVDMSAFSW